MSRFEIFIGRLNFKIIIIAYAVSAVVIGSISLGFLAVTFRDRLTFAYEYRRISEKTEDGNRGLGAVKQDLISLADTTSDTVDILILNPDNRILFSAKNSNLAKDGVLDLAGNYGRRDSFLTSRTDSNVYLWPVRNDRLILSKAMLSLDNDVRREFEERYFYKSGFDAMKVYLLYHLADVGNGKKVYFISDIRPTPGGEFRVKAVAAIATLFFMLYWILTALWTYAQAAKAKLNAPMWGLVTLFTNLAGLFIFFIYRQNNHTCYRCGASQGKTNNYCAFCGAKLNATCGNCSAAMNGKDDYCGQCGSKSTDRNPL